MALKEFRAKKGKIHEYKILINGKWRTSAKKSEVFNPYNGRKVGVVQFASKKDREMAVNSAFKAKDKMAALSANERAAILEKAAEIFEEHKEEFVKLIIEESGKARKWVEGEVHATVLNTKYVAHEARNIKGEVMIDDKFTPDKGKIGVVVKQPIGVVLTISPFNYPLFTGATKIVAAIAAGNAVVAKPASDDPLSLLMFAAVMHEAGLPKGALNVITCPGKEMVDLVTHEKIGGISFTGSSAVGDFITKNAGLKKLMMELGGKSPAIVLDDADLDLAAEQVLIGVLKVSGQRCDAFSRVIVLNKVANRFVKKVMEKLKKWKMGDPKNPKVLIGPLINEKALEKVDVLVKDAVKKGAKVLAGGKKRGLFYYPTVLDRVTSRMDIAWKETFGPVVTIMRVEDVDGAVELANHSEYGLDAAVFTSNQDKAFMTALRLEDGTVQINGATSHGIGKFPFGGFKHSGFGREGIEYAIEEMMKVKSIVFNLKK